MTEVVEAIGFLRERGARLSVDGNTIRVSYRCRASELQKVKGAIATIRTHKPEAIAALQSPPAKCETDRFVTLCPLCAKPYTQRLHAIPEWQPESFRKQIEESRCAWFHQVGMLSLSTAEPTRSGRAASLTRPVGTGKVKGQ